ncbi:hypothetical protein AAVH_30047 [Aphelenchoides avenae]|nr:hypothetical protein AAVH_30047 [Aphelenchus avenae]
MEVEVQVREQQVDELKQKLSKAHEQLKHYKSVHGQEFFDTLSSGAVTDREEAEPTKLQDDDVVDIKPDKTLI